MAMTLRYFKTSRVTFLKKEAPAARERAKEILTIKKQLNIRLKQAREIQKKYYNKKHKPIQYQPGDLVMLLSRNITIKRPSKKLDAKFLKPFKIVETKGKQAYKLDLPQTYSRIHNIFYVSLLKLYKQRPGNMLPEPTPIKGQLKHKVEQIKDMRNINGRIEYL